MEEAKQYFKVLFISSTFSLKGNKQFQPFNWFTLQQECKKFNIELKLNLKDNYIKATYSANINK